MNKSLVVVGGIIALIGVFFQFVDKTMGWWMYWTEFGDISYYLSLTGVISNSNNTNTSELDSNTTLLIILALAVLGAILMVMTLSKNGKTLGFLGIVIIFAALGYFVYSLPNVFDGTLVEGLMALADTTNYFYGTFDIGPISTSWRVGNGFLITAAGAIVGLVGTFVKGN